MKMYLLTAFLCLTIPALAETFTITDYTKRGFAPDVVTYTIAVKPGEAAQLRLTDTQGQPVPFQVTKPDAHGQAQLSFVTDLPANGHPTFTLTRDGKGPLGVSALQTRLDGHTLVLDNTLCAVKVPAPTVQRWKVPVAAKTLPAPVLAFRSGAQGAWWGEGKVLSERLVTAWRVITVAHGPAFVAVRYELDYAGGGYYHATVQLADRVPMARVTEEYDLGRQVESDAAASNQANQEWHVNPQVITPEKDLWELNLTRGWQPDTVEQSVAWGNGGGGDTGTTGPLANFQPSILMNAGAYGAGRISTFGLYRAADAKADPNYPGVGITPLHNGFWRRAMNMALARPAPDQVALRLPMTRTSPRWVETSPFCVAPQDPEQPYTYARRQWGLLLGVLPVPILAHDGNTPTCRSYQARLTYGTVGIDRYKDYILDWPDTKPTYPRVFARADQLPRYRAALTPENPLTAPMMDRSYTFSGKAYWVSANMLNQTMNNLQHLIYSALGYAAQSHHAACDAGGLMISAEDLLGYPELPVAQRQSLRARLALLAYLFTEPDVNGQGSGSHTGNPNMSLARQGWISTTMALLPDHPMYTEWRDYMAKWTAFKFADNMAPSGGWVEPGTYQEWGYQRLIWSLLGLEAMQVKDIERIRAYHLADSEFYMNLLTPFDPRWRARMIPGFGNNATHYTSMWLDSAAAVEATHPKQAAELMWAWQNNGMQLSDAVPGLARPWIQPQEPKLNSQYFPGFGIVFRAHPGPDETYMLLRSGFLWSHWTVDQGNMSLYSKGAVLLPPQPYTYFSSQLPEYSQENDLRFGHPANEFRYAWPDSNILDYHLGNRIQYAWASSGYPAWFITPGITEGFGDGPKLQAGLKQQEGEFWWNRQVAFLIGQTAKSPNYFVFHDTITGNGRLAQWFNLNLLGRKEDVKLDGSRLHVQTEWPTSLEIAFADDRPRTMELTEENQSLNVQYSIYGRTYAKVTKDFPVSKNWFRQDGKPVDREKLQVPDQERHVLIRMPAAAGQDHFWLAYPLGEGETAPKVERLATNVIKVTHPEGTDFILLSATPDRFEGQDVVLEGQAACVRVAPAGITCALLGGAGRVGYRGQLFAGVDAFERTLPANAVKPGVEVIAPENTDTLACAPRLKAHQPVAPGISKAIDGARTEYVVDNPTPVTFTDGDLRLEARKALVTRGPDSVRFAVPEGTYVQLVAGKTAIRGLGPFDLTMTATQITGTVAGRKRTLVVSKPAGIIRPMYEMDQVRWYAGYPDDPAPYRGRPEAQFSLAFGVNDGRHEINVREWESPQLPPVPARTALTLK